jgi:hypothetical protein
MPEKHRNGRWRSLAAVLWLAVASCQTQSAPAADEGATPTPECAKKCSTLRGRFGFCGNGETGSEAEARAGQKFKDELNKWEALKKDGYACTRPLAMAIYCD